MTTPQTVTEAQAALPVVALIRDLMFASRVGAEAKNLGVTIKMIRDPQKLAGIRGRRLIVDLNLEGAIDPAAAWGREQGAEVVGFVAHTDAAAIARARELGIGRVMARSQFVQVLPDLLRDGGAG